MPEELVRLAEVRYRAQAFKALRALRTSGLDRINIWPIGRRPWWLPVYLGPYTIMVHEDDLQQARRIVEEMGLGDALCK
jgi:hypothetical protein